MMFKFRSLISEDSRECSNGLKTLMQNNYQQLEIMRQTVNKTFKLIVVLMITLFPLGFNAAFSPTSASVSKQTERVYQFINGQWFDGRTFRRLTFYSVNGVLTDKKPRTVDEVVDLQNGYVVPPFADAHCHHFDTPYNINQQIEMYLREGVFYAAVQGNMRSGALKVADKINNPTSIDVAYAHGALTRTFGHGLEVFETLALGLVPTTKVIEANKQKIAASRRRENDAYYIIDSAEELEQKWQKILHGKPNFLKIFLLHSDEFDQRLKNIPNIKLGHIGLDPRLVPLIVRKAHDSGFRVSAHVENAADYRIALANGVDEMAHLPGYYFELNENPNDYQLTEKDVRETAKRKVWVIPTPNLPQSFDDPAVLQRVEAVAKHNLALLKKHRARIAFGADAYMQTPLEYVLYLSRLGVFSNLEMLKIWCEKTPEAIFPNRKIGKLKSGYETSFLVLDGNPLEDFQQVKNIRLRFKQGLLINLNGKK